jgi:DNA polymerase-3 subunit alpha
MTVSAGFVHLQVHSEYSLADGIVRIKDLAKRTASLGMPAVAVTDRGNLFALLKFYQACLDTGIKPLLGIEVRYRIAGGGLAKALLLAMNQNGYNNLLRLASHAYVGGAEHSLVTADAIVRYQDGLIMLSGGRQGEVGNALASGDTVGASAIAAGWGRVFERRFYLELQRTGRPGDEASVRAHVELARELSLPVVATNEVCFLLADDFEAHETRICIHQGRVLNDPRRERGYSAAQYLKSPGEMIELFGDIPEAIANTVAIARRCNVVLTLGKPFLPNYPVTAGETLESHLDRMSEEGLARRLLRVQQEAARAGATGGKLPPEASAYRERLAFELGVIKQMGFAGYFLIVMEFIGWAREQGIPVGPGRGSGAGSLVAYCLGITDLDPLAYDLLFERFLNPERVSMPDFDVDFCMEGRDRVISHVSERYGHAAVSQIITFGTMAAKAVVRDVARVQGKPYGLADKLSKLIPFEVGMTLDKAVTETRELRDFIASSDEVGEIMEMAYKLEGIVRNVGRHAGGVVIAPTELADFVPLYTEEPGGSLVAQFDKDDVEKAGLVKFDFLGLKTLTIIDWCVKAINADRPEEPLDIESIPLRDASTFGLLKRAETAAVFQLESRGMRDLIRRLLPDNIEDIIALVALFRPGPLQSGAVDDYINRKHGQEPVDYPHASLEWVLSGTYGVVLYQEQVMQIAQVLAGFSLGQADLLRRAMGKKKPEEMAKVRKQFLEGCAARSVDEGMAGDIFDLMEKFAGYAFNKSHSATYALVSYQTAYLKAHFPAHFMAANLSADMHNIDRVVQLIDDVRRMQLALCPPDINRSDFRFVVRDGAIVYGLGAVRGVGEGPVELIVAERQRGLFVSLADFCQRIDGRKVNRRVIEALIRSGAMDGLSADSQTLNARRALLLAELPAAIQGAEQVSRDRSLGIVDLFGGVTAGSVPVAVKVDFRPMDDGERLAAEKGSLGLYLTGHPVDPYLPELRAMCRTRLVDLVPDRKTQFIGGTVVSIRVMKSKRGGNNAYVVIDDRSARIEATLFNDVWDSFREHLREDAPVILEGVAHVDEFNGGEGTKFRVERVLPMEEARRRFARAVEIRVAPDSSTDRNGATPQSLVKTLSAVLAPYRLPEQGCGVSLIYTSSEAMAHIWLGEEWRVRPSDELLRSLRDRFGSESTHLAYLHATV